VMFHLTSGMMSIMTIRRMDREPFRTPDHLFGSVQRDAI
jgi:hypothetical protein